MSGAESTDQAQRQLSAGHAMAYIQSRSDVFRKAVEVIHCQPQTGLSLLERKIGNALIRNAISQPSDGDGWWAVRWITLEEDVGFDSNNRDVCRKAALALMHVVCEWDVLSKPGPAKKNFKASVLFPEIEYDQEKLRFKISTELRDLTINPIMYSLVDMSVVRRFRSAASLAIWENVVRYSNLRSTPPFPWEKFRDMILGEGAGKSSYSQYKFFKSKCLNKAIEEINRESSHTLTLKEEKVGRRITNIWFEIERKKVVVVEEEDEAKRDLFGNPDVVDLIERVRALGVPKAQATRFVAEHDAAAIKAAIEYTKARIADPTLEKVQRPGAYFRTALKDGFSQAKSVEGKLTEEKGIGKAKSIVPVIQDVSDAFKAHQRGLAVKYLDGIDDAKRSELISQYNSTVKFDGFRMGGVRESVGAKANFISWLCKELWGEPSTQDLAEFASTMNEAVHGGYAKA